MVGWEGRTLGSVATLLADNLGAHQIGGFCQSFGKNVSRFCRYCLAKKSEYQDDRLHIWDHTRRNPENYRVHLERYLSGELARKSKYGVTSDSVLHQLHYGHVTRMLPPCIAHDLGEGKADVETAYRHRYAKRFYVCAFFCKIYFSIKKLFIEKIFK